MTSRRRCRASRRVAGIRGDLLFDTTRIRRRCRARGAAALEQRASLGDVKGVVPSLRAAFGYALGIDGRARARRRGLAARADAARRSQIADGGREVAARELFDERSSRARRADEERARGCARLESGRTRSAARRGAAPVPRDASTRARRRARADDALDSAGARMLTLPPDRRAARSSTSRTRSTASASSRSSTPTRCRSSIRASASRARTACSRSTRCRRSSARRSRKITSTSRGMHEGRSDADGASSARFAS